MTPPEPDRLRLDVATFNAGDDGNPPNADLVAIQEAPEDVRDHYGPRWRVWQPPRNRSLAIASRKSKFHRDERGILKAHDGRAGVTPGRHVMWETYDTDAGPLALVNTHVINNAWGINIRGERGFRLKCWWRTVRLTRRVVRRLRREDHLVFVAGDFNRVGRWAIGGLKDASPRERYDRIFYTRRHKRTGRKVKLLRAELGKRRGSDHAPIVCEFEIRR